MSSPLTSSLDSDFFQYSLLGELATPDEPTKKRDVKPSRRGRGYDLSLLRYVGWNRYVTLHQLIYRFFIYDGKGYRYGFRLAQDLIARGLLHSEMLDPEKGSTSRQVLSLSDEGWKYIGISRRKEPRTNNPLALREYSLQFAEMMLERETEGWTLATGGSKFERLRRWSLKKYRTRTLTDTERLQRDQVEKVTAEKIKIPMLVHRVSEEPRLVLPIRQGVSYRRMIERLPSFALFLGVNFELVCPDPELGVRAEDYLKRWASKTKTEYQLYQVPNFRTRTHPKDAVVPAHSRYATNQVPAPRTLI